MEEEGKAPGTERKLNRAPGLTHSPEATRRKTIEYPRFSLKFYFLRNFGTMAKIFVSLINRKVGFRDPF